MPGFCGGGGNAVTVGAGVGEGAGAVTVVGASGAGLPAVALGVLVGVADGVGAGDDVAGSAEVLDGGGVGLGVVVVREEVAGAQIGSTEFWPSSLSWRMASSRVPPGRPAETWARSDSRRSASFSGWQPERLSSTPMLVIELRESRQAI